MKWSMIIITQSSLQNEDFVNACEKNWKLDVELFQLCTVLDEI